MGSELNRPTVLIVDDEAINKELLIQALQDEFDILTASSGAEALELAEHELPDTILLDILMPDMNGYEVCHELRTNPITKHIPIIFSTSKCSLEDEVRGLNMGAGDYVTKPYNMALVKARVRNQVLLKLKTDLLEQMVNVDGLTKIPNRRYFDDTFEQEWRRAIRNQYPISIGMFDIDSFKLYNDNYGHVAGDDCLARVAVALSSQARRAGDFVARYGGEEFVFVWPNCPEKKALDLANRVRKAVIKMALPHEYSPVDSIVTVSGGVASIYPQKDSKRIDLLQEADKNLYSSKKAGKNRVTNSKGDVMGD